MTSFVKYPLAIQTFSKIHEQNYLYIDKTTLIHDLIQQGEVYFLSRPLRFGKSLLVTTFEALFCGQKESLQILTIDEIKKYIINNTNEHARHYDIEHEIDSYEQRFDELLTKLEAKTGRNKIAD